MIWPNLHGANLRNADLSWANLYQADLSGACYNDATRWHSHFPPPVVAVKVTD